MANYGVNINFKVQSRPLDKAVNQLRQIDKLRNSVSKQNLEFNKAALKIIKQELTIKNNILKADRSILKVRREQIKANKANAATHPISRTGGGGGGRGAIGGAGFNSAIISGVFPLLFGQGPFAALGGATGGFLGGRFGGQRGGFAGGLAGTAIATSIQSFTSSISELGQAINSVNKDTTPLISALGLTGSEYEKQIKTLESLGDKEAAFDLVRQKMTQQVGSDGVQALSSFGDETKKLSDGFSVFMLNMRVGMANLIEQSGVLRSLARSVETGVGMEKARTLAVDDPEFAKLISQFENVGKRGLIGSITQAFKDPQADKREKDRILDEITALVKKKQTEKEIRAINEAVNKAAQKKLTTEIQLLEKSKEKGHLSELEFKIEQQLQNLKDKGIKVDEVDFANKMRKLDALKEERKLALELAATYDKIGQSIEKSIVGNLTDAVMGTQSLGQAAVNVLNTLKRKLIEVQIEKAVAGIGEKGLGSAIGGFFKGIFGKRGSGGPVSAGGAYLVGEKGPEILQMGSRGGNIIPNNKIEGGTTNMVTVNVDASGSSVSGNNADAQALGAVIGAAVQAQLVKEKRPGGLLTR